MTPSPKRPPVALVNMPFASIQVPSISLGLLKSCLARRGVNSDVLYLNIEFAALAGDLEFYEAVPTAGLVGEVAFAPYLGRRGGEVLVAGPTADGCEVREDARAGALGRLPSDRWDTVSKVIGPFLDRCMSRIAWADYQIIGFTSTFAQNVAALCLAQRIKGRYPDKYIVFGGPNVWGEMGHALLRSFRFVDFVVDGEAEQSFPQLVDQILSGRPRTDIPGVSGRDGETISVSTRSAAPTDLDACPFPDYRDYFQQLSANHLRTKIVPQLLVETSRGCWRGEDNRCLFCGLNGDLRYRAKSPQRALDEILALSRTHHVVDVEFVDNVIESSYFTTLLPAITREGHDLRFFFETRATLRKAEVATLYQAGVRSIQPGIESFSSTLLALMNKGTKAWHNVQLLKWCREIGIKPLWNILYGFPREDPAEYGAMTDVILAMTHCEPPLALGRLILPRFSPYWRAPDRFGIEDVRPHHLYRYMYPDAAGEWRALAYYFDYGISALSADPEEYAAPLKRAVALWQRLHRENKTKLKVWGGPGFVEIVDRRPRTLDDDDPQERRIVLTGPPAELYLYCDAAQHVDGLLRRGSELGLRAEQVLDIVERLVRNRLMYRDDTHCVSLAVRAH